MNHWNNEYMAEYHRQDLIQEAGRVHRERAGIRSRANHPGLFARAMYNLGSWMIARGRQLRKRYQVPPTACSNTPSGSYAH